jgi:hypothetical protein
MIYFIQSGQYGPIKIGYTDNLEKRLRSLQTGNHDDLRLIYSMPGERDDEKALHTKFAKHHIRGEWFRSDGEIIGYYLESFRTFLTREWKRRKPAWESWLDETDEMKMSLLEYDFLSDFMEDKNFPEINTIRELAGYLNSIKVRSCVEAREAALSLWHKYECELMGVEYGKTS